jgi:hypothetical protein
MCLSERLSGAPPKTASTPRTFKFTSVFRAILAHRLVVFSKNLPIALILPLIQPFFALALAPNMQ